MMLNNISIVLSSPGAVAFTLGNLSVRWYGIFVALGFFLAYLTSEHIIKKYNYDLEKYSDLILIVLLSGIISARLWFVILNFDYFKNNLSEIPKIWLGGQSIQGGIIGGILTSLLYSKIKKISFYIYADIIALSLPLAQAIGRWGNFFNNEAYGKPFNGIIKLYIPFEFRKENFLNVEYYHPTFLYESFFNLVIFFILLKKYPSWKDSPGKTFWIYLISYSSVRFFLEFIRLDSLYIFTQFPAAQVISIIMILVSIVGLKISPRKL